MILYFIGTQKNGVCLLMNFSAIPQRFLSGLSTLDLLRLPSIKGLKMKIDVDNYAADFVRKVTSEESNHTSAFVRRVNQVDEELNASLLLTAALGMCTESGEFGEVVKKVFFQGKPIDAKQKEALKKELGDIAWYWANGCRALGIPPSQVLEENVMKLESRYPGGEFDSFYSENRAEDDE
jgi:NTP pyrophosphatase (non-canonical NTP hydrolase)